jgi:hypothetical protein
MNSQAFFKGLNFLKSMKGGAPRLAAAHKLINSCLAFRSRHRLVLLVKGYHGPSNGAGASPPPPPPPPPPIDAQRLRDEGSQPPRRHPAWLQVTHGYLSRSP